MVAVLISIVGFSLTYLTMKSFFSRSPREVIEDLWEDESEDACPRRNKKGFFSKDKEIKCEKGFLTSRDLFLFRRISSVGATLGGIFVAIICLVLGVTLYRSMFCGLIFISGIYLLSTQWIRGRLQWRRKELDFFLPVVMERLVMAVQAGLDILPALRTIIELERDEGDGHNLDPVTTLLLDVHTLCESGATLDQALSQVGKRVDSSALRHAFLHLAVSHREGGELVMPLRELSDSTQLFFQESIEEEIARMPVKATMPLLCTFAGLVLSFLTTPLIQLMSITAKALPQ